MKRQAWLDYIKLIAMTLVVIYHTPPRYDNAREAALFNMGAPVFFFAAGYLFNIARQQNFLTFLRHRARQILVPYTTFFIIFYALWLVVGRRMAGPEEQAIDVLAPVWQFVQGTPDVVLGPFWFLAALFTMQVIYYPIRKYLSGVWPLVAACCSACRCSCCPTCRGSAGGTSTRPSCICPSMPWATVAVR